MIKKINIFFILLYISLSTSFIQLHAQDVHFSQFENSPLLLNPALTGQFDNQYRFSTIYRNQWGSFVEPYRTISAAFDGNTSALGSSLLNYDQVGYGAVVINDRSGGLLNVFKLFLSAAYQKAFGFGKKANHTLSLGFQAGFVQKHIDYSVIVFPDQIDPNNLAAPPHNPTGEDFNNVNFFTPDFSVGLLWYYNKLGNYNKRRKLKKDNEIADEYKFGLTLSHFNNPKDNFLSEKNRLQPQFTVYGESRIVLAYYNLNIYPKIMYQKQRTARELNVGIDFEYILLYSKKKYLSLILGTRYRFLDAIIFVGGIRHKNWQLMYSYDVNHSSLREISYGRGAGEISIVHIQQKSKKIHCPRY